MILQKKKKEKNKLERKYIKYAIYYFFEVVVQGMHSINTLQQKKNFNKEIQISKQRRSIQTGLFHILLSFFSQFNSHKKQTIENP